MPAPPTRFTRIAVDGSNKSQLVPSSAVVMLLVDAGDYSGSVPIPFKARVIQVAERHEAAGTDAGEVSVMVKKIPSGVARADGSDVLAAPISLKEAANANQTGVLHAWEGNLTLFPGDALGLQTTGDFAGVDGVAVTVQLEIL